MWSATNRRREVVERRRLVRAERFVACAPAVCRWRKAVTSGSDRVVGQLGDIKLAVVQVDVREDIVVEVIG